MPKRKEIIYSYPNPGKMEQLEFTNSRNVALGLIGKGFVPCQTPQMFEQEEGVYGLYLQEGGKPVCSEEAESILSSCEQSAREVNQRIVYPSGATGFESRSQTNVTNR